MARIFHPLLALIASGTDRELAKYVQFLKEENKILRARIPGEIHTRPDERQQHLLVSRDRRPGGRSAGVLHQQPALKSPRDRAACAFPLEHRELAAPRPRCHFYSRREPHSERNRHGN